MSAMTTPESLPRPSPQPVLSIDIEQVRSILPQIINSLSDAVVVVDRDQRVVAANRRYLDTFGVRRADVIGAPCSEALHCPEARDGPSSSCSACGARDLREPVRRLRNLPDATGTVHRWEVTYNPVVGHDDQVSHVVEVWRDISERSQLEAQLAHSERLASLGMLAAGVAHEINNPLASILSGVERLQRWLTRTPSLPPESAREAAEVLDGLARETLRCRETTEKLLLLGQPYRVALGWVNLNRSVRDTMALLNHQMTRHAIEAVQDLDPDLPMIWARESGMRGVCMNLAMNAVQAMPNGGRLALRTRRIERGVELTVEDTGPGISPQHLDRIWDPFFTTKPLGQGTGLGLSITQQVVTRHGGTIRVESRPGEGARFIVELPVEGPGGDVA
jgi:PAS domain S-box-containing protein